MAPSLIAHLFWPVSLPIGGSMCSSASASAFAFALLLHPGAQMTLYLIIVSGSFSRYAGGFS